MKVYIVVERMYGTTELISCFRARTEAHAFIEKQANQRSFSIIEMEVK